MRGSRNPWKTAHGPSAGSWTRRPRSSRRRTGWFRRWCRTRTDTAGVGGGCPEQPYSGAFRGKAPDDVRLNVVTWRRNVPLGWVGLPSMTALSAKSATTPARAPIRAKLPGRRVSALGWNSPAASARRTRPTYAIVAVSRGPARAKNLACPASLVRVARLLSPIVLMLNGYAVGQYVAIC